jgi:hypothetical protein
MYYLLVPHDTILSQTLFIRRDKINTETQVWYM